MGKVETLMQKLKISRAEALEVMRADQQIDEGVNLFELDEEGKAVEKKMRQADRDKDAPTIYKFEKRQRKPNEDKREIIGRLKEILENWFTSDESHTFNAVTNLEVTNPEREMEFTFNGKKYKLTLSAPRK